LLVLVRVPLSVSSRLKGPMTQTQRESVAS